MEKIVVGIDLGTTFSSVAYVDKDGVSVVIPNADGKKSTPSAVLIQDGQIIVGDTALHQWATNGDHVIRWIKRSMGSESEKYRFQDLSPVEISAEILKVLKRDAEAALQTTITDAVITCPAYFSAVEIENTQKAGILAGLNVREIVKEPTAAAVFYGIENMSEGEKILVCDLGGGTFDATVLSYDKGVFTPLASMGDRCLGGHDWTMILVDLVAERYLERCGADPREDVVASQLLYDSCEQAKRDFARVSEVTIPCSCASRTENIKISRDDFETASEWRIQQMVMWSDEAVKKAGLTWKQIDTILLVGGSSRLRRVSLALQEVSGKKPVMSREPDYMVALGAAILARGKVRRRGRVTDANVGFLTDIEYKRIAVRSLGTRVILFENDVPRITNSLIIHHGAETPVTCSRQDYEISVDDQEFFDVPAVEFENDDDYDPIDNFRFKCLPNARHGDRIKVTFHYDISGIPTITAFDLKSGVQLSGERTPYVEPDLEEVIRIRVRPRWVVFAVDTSGSMYGTKMLLTQQAILENARNLIQAGGDKCKVGIVSFSSVAKIVCRPLNDLAVIETAVNQLAAEGTTSMDEGILQAVELVLTAPAGCDRDVVMVTDGMPDDQRKQSTVSAAAYAKRMGVTLSTLGIGKQDVDFNFLQSLTPLSLVIEASENLGKGAGTLLTQAAASRTGKLTDFSQGGLVEGGRS